MAKSFQVNMVTPEKTAFEQEAVSVIIPGTEGYLGIWANHAPLVTSLRPGVVEIKLDDAGNTKFMSVTGGFVEVSCNTVNIMCDTCEESSEIDVERVKTALERARQMLKSGDDEVDLERARKAVDRAEARMRAIYLSGQ